MFDEEYWTEAVAVISYFSPLESHFAGEEYWDTGRKGRVSPEGRYFVNCNYYDSDTRNDQEEIFRIEFDGSVSRPMYELDFWSLDMTWSTCTTDLESCSFFINNDIDNALLKFDYDMNSGELSNE